MKWVITHKQVMDTALPGQQVAVVDAVYSGYDLDVRDGALVLLQLGEASEGGFQETKVSDIFPPGWWFAVHPATAQDEQQVGSSLVMP